MVNVDILEGLRSSLAKGKSLKQTMISFYNAGYKKEEIEEAARALQVQQFQQIQPHPTAQAQQKVQAIKPQPTTQSAQLRETKPQIQPQQPIQPVKPRQLEPKKHPRKLFKKSVKIPKIRKFRKTIVKQKPERVAQKVSSYQKPAKKPERILMTFVLIFILLVLLGVLAAVFFFKTDLIGFFNSLFS